MAAKRIKRWTKEERAWVEALPPSEREVVELLVARLNARPADEVEDNER